MEKNNDNSKNLSKIISIINKVKFISFIFLILIFFYQQYIIYNDADSGSYQFVRVAIFIIAGITFSSLISGLILKKGKKGLKITIITISIIGVILLFFILNLDKILLHTDIFETSNRLPLYLMLGIILLSTIATLIIKINYNKPQST